LDNIHKFSFAGAAPSFSRRFEGWSSLMKMRALAKCIYVSDIPIHREQIHLMRSFSIHTPEELAELLVKDKEG
jgi:hypothetical protein